MRKLLPAWLTPAADSAAAALIRQGKSPWSDGVHLLWSLWVFITPIFSPHGYSLRWAMLTLASYPLFVLLYAMTLLVPARKVYRYALAMVALSMAMLPWYPAGISYFIFGCIMLHIHGVYRLGRYLVHLLLLNIVFVGYGLWIGYPWQSLVWIPPMTLIVGLVVGVERIGREKDAALKLSHDEVRRLAATSERERIGRDLHDLLGHTLSLITLKLELSRKLFDRDGVAARRELEEAERVARHALAEVRSAVTGIRATDLAAELAAARLLLESSQVHLDYDLPPPDLAPEVERGLSLVLREAVTNVARHARASRVRIAFARAGDVVQLRIVDDGSGGIASDGNGLSGMRERVSALGGTLAIESPAGQGTRLLASVPAKAARGQAESVQDAGQHEPAASAIATRLRVV